MKTDRAVPKLVLAACVVIFFTLGAGYVLHRNVNRLIQARDWVEHSSEVQSNLENIQLRLDRLDSIAHLYLLQPLPDTLRQTVNLSVTVETSAQRLVDQVSDNPAQRENSLRLHQCTHDLAESLRGLDVSGALFPAKQHFACREIVVVMQEAERTLLEKRTQESRDSTLSLMVVGILLAAFSIIVVTVLFGVLVRDALFRRTSQQQLALLNDRDAATILALEDRAAELKLLSDARDQLQICLSPKEAYAVCVHFVEQLLPTSSGALCMIDNSRQTIDLQAHWGGNVNTLESFSLDGCCAMRTGQIRWRTADISVLHCAHFIGTPPPCYVCLPLIAHAETLGILHIECPGDEMTRRIEKYQGPLNALLQLTSMTVAGLNLRSKLENQSIRDSLTGLFNRRFMEISLERELRRNARRDAPLAVFMIDTDNFKLFNDTFGHKAGDMVLRAIAQRFLTCVRAEDIVCRYGGEEFVIILPDITAQRAAERAEQIRRAIHDLRVSDLGQTFGPVTVSIGVAMCPQDGRDIEELLQTSDRALYAAKNAGRNRVAFAGREASAPAS